MTVYVDDVRHSFGRMVMCHMWADTLDELLAAADAIGVQRKWIQGHPTLSFGKHRNASWVHFDISLTMKARAIARGAILTDKYGPVEHTSRLQILSGNPATAERGGCDAGEGTFHSRSKDRCTAVPRGFVVSENRSKLLLNLAMECEAAKAGTLPVDMLRDAFEAVHGPKPPRLHGGSDELTDWLRKFNPFFSMLEVKAYESAAMMLIPEGWHTRLATEDRHSHSWRWELRGGYGVNVGARGASTASAIAAAALRAYDAILKMVDARCTMRGTALPALLSQSITRAA